MAQSLGQLDEAKADLLRAIELDPSDGEAFRAYVSGQKTREGDPVVDQIEQALSRSDLKPRSRWRFHFAMAKALSDLGRHDEVFAHLHAANSLQRKAYPYDFGQVFDRARKHIAVFRDNLAGRPVSGAPGHAIFVTGAPRSGTTLVENIFAAHPDVTAGGELSFLSDAMSPLVSAFEQGAMVEPDDLTEPGRLYLAAARRRTGAKKAFTDKAIGTFSRIGFAGYALPDAPFFVLKRDPRDVALSCYRNMFADGVQRFSNDLYDIGRLIRLQEAMVAAWQTLLPNRVHIVDYEDLTAEPEPLIRQMVAQAGLEWNDACLAPHKAERRVHTLSFAQVRSPIYRESVSGWRRYETEFEPLERGLAESFDLL